MWRLQRMQRADSAVYKRSSGYDPTFNLSICVKFGGENRDFVGPFAQGNCGERCIALLIGTLAGDSEDGAIYEMARPHSIHLDP